MIHDRKFPGSRPWIEKLPKASGRMPEWEGYQRESAVVPTGMYKLVAVIPAYNEAHIIGQVIQETREHVDYVYVIDDCSTDNTEEIARASGAHVIRHDFNRGPGASLQTGCQAAIEAGFDFLVQVDGDGQHNPKYIPEMMQVALNSDLVIASRFLNGSHKSFPLVRRVGVAFFSRIISLLGGVEVTDVTSGFRLYRLEALKKMSTLPNRHWAIHQTMEAAKKDFRIREISAKMPVRANGKSQFSFLTYSLYPIRMVFAILRCSLTK